jgi:adenosyl cobinamide kinase/adenosyl cobinamide phosphate guanylyltransferase
MTTNLFDDQTNDDNVDYLAELVGDGKKFRTVEDLAKGKAESDRYIATLTAQLDEARTEVQKRIALEELKTAILERDNNNNQLTPGQPEQKPVVDADSIEELVNKKLTEAEATKIRNANEAAVADKLTSVWGENAKVELARAGAAIGMSLKELQEIGQRNPQALFKLIGVGNQPVANGGAVPRSSERSGNDNLNGERTKAYYDKLKASNPKAYWDKRNQIQMNKDAMRLKERFYV